MKHFECGFLAVVAVGDPDLAISARTKLTLKCPQSDTLAFPHSHLDNSGVRLYLQLRNALVPRASSARSCYHPLQHTGNLHRIPCLAAAGCVAVSVQLIGNCLKALAFSLQALDFREQVR